MKATYTILLVWNGLDVVLYDANTKAQIMQFLNFWKMFRSYSIIAIVEDNRDTKRIEEIYKGKAIDFKGF